MTTGGYNAGRLAASRVLVTDGAVLLPALSVVFLVDPTALVPAAATAALLVATHAAREVVRARRAVAQLLQAAAEAGDADWARDVLDGVGVRADPDGLAPSLVAGALRAATLANRHARAMVTERDQVARGMSELFARRVYAEDRAAATIAAELHDTVAQSLTAALWSLENGTDPAAAIEDVRAAERELRAVLAMNRPPELDGDVAQAVRGLCDDMATRYGLTVDVVAWPDDDVEISDTGAGTLYRFLQEALRNVVHHSGVHHATIAVTFAGGQVRVDVTDQGSGFDPAAVHPVGGRHVGLLLMNDRARASGGTTTITSAPGQGTTVSLTLPVLDAAG